MKSKQIPDTTKYQKVFPSRLREVMETNGVGQKDLAEALGISRQAVGYYINGATNPNCEQVAIIAKALNVSSDYLLGLTEVPTVDTTTRAICDATGLSKNSVDNIRKLQQMKENNSSVALNDALDSLLSNGELLVFWAQSVARLMDKWQSADEANVLLEQEMSDEASRLRSLFGNSVFVTYGKSADHFGMAAAGLLFNNILENVRSEIYRKKVQEGKTAQAMWVGVQKAYPEVAKKAAAAAQLSAKLKFEARKAELDRTRDESK